MQDRQDEVSKFKINAEQVPNDIVITWKEQQPASLLTQTGEWLEMHGAPNHALTYYEAALSVDPEYSIAAWRSGQLAFNRHDYTYAAAKFEYILRIMPDHAPTLYSTSLAYSGMGNTERALFFAEKALSYNPKHDGAYLQKLRSLCKLEQWTDINSVCRSLPDSLKQAGEPHIWCAIAAIHVGDLQTGRYEYEQLPSKIRKQFPVEIALIEKLLM